MTIIQVLLGEHGAMYPLFERIEKTAEAADLTGLRLQASLLEAILISHADLEDALLRPEIRQFLPPAVTTADGTPVPTDHELIRAGLADAFTAANEQEARRCLLDTVAQTRKHFLKEESTIFTIALRELSSQRQKELAAEWARRRGAFIN